MSNSKAHIVLVGHEGSHNRGCEALVRTSIEVIRRGLPDCRITIVSMYPEHDCILNDVDNINIVPGYCATPYLYETNHDTNSKNEEIPIGEFSDVSRCKIKKNLKYMLPYGAVQLHRKLIAKSKRDVKKAGGEICDCGKYEKVLHLKSVFKSADMVVSIGGDLFIEDWGIPEYAMQTMELAQELGIPTVIWGASIWPLKDTRTVDRVKSILQQSCLITVRDHPTVLYLRDLGVKENVCEVADGAFIMSAKSSQYTTLIWSDNETQVMGFNGSPLVEYFLGREHASKTIREMIDYFRWLIDRLHFKVVFIVHDAYPASREFEFLYEIRQAINRPTATYIPPLGLGAQEVKAVISQCDCFIAMRFHASIAALSQSIPTMGLSYSPKFKGLHESVYGHTDLLVSYENISFSLLKEKTEYMQANQESLKECLVERVAILKKNAMNGSDPLRKMLLQA